MPRRGSPLRYVAALMNMDYVGHRDRPHVPFQERGDACSLIQKTEEDADLYGKFTLHTCSFRSL